MRMYDGGILGLAYADQIGRTLGEIDAGIEAVDEWQEANPHVADYRVNEALAALRKARYALGHVQMGTHYPEWEAARRRAVKTMGLDQD
ncbi:hypothetical protein ABZV77_11505 [Streptomyces sp. NPDC004732]|uniref:hypothetical protein n=1 Tax=Streptomyces sp. NPDC004732 TaxID=3154290 RepID=UPI0033A341BB